MTKTFLISDHHFSQQSILTFKRDDDSLLRPGFESTEEMDEHMINSHNSVVSNNDKVYFLGDIHSGASTRFDSIMSRLNGNKVLIKGNHDKHKLVSYSKWFKDIRAYSNLDRCILSHIPISTGSLGRFALNIHGHTHARNVMLDNGELDVRYFCVCVEQPHIDYTPIDFEQIREFIKKTFD